MVEAPNRIWAAGADHGSGNSAGTWFAKDKVGVEYVRADIAASQLAEKQKQLDELPSKALWDESRKALASMRNEVGELKRQLAEAMAELDAAKKDQARDASLFLSRGAIIAQDERRIADLERQLAEANERYARDAHAKMVTQEQLAKARAEAALEYAERQKAISIAKEAVKESQRAAEYFDRALAAEAERDRLAADNAQKDRQIRALLNTMTLINRRASPDPHRLVGECCDELQRIADIARAALAAGKE